MKVALLTLTALVAGCAVVDEPRSQPSEAVAVQHAQTPTPEPTRTPSATSATSDTAARSEVVAATEHFVFHSNFLFGLHDYLDWLVDEGEEQPADEADCLAALAGGEKEGWERALAAYREDFGKREQISDGEMIALRYRLGGLDAGEFGERFREPVEALVELLDGAAPAYRRCVWQAQDERNREWIAAALPLVKAHEAELSKRLSGYFAEPWPDTPTPVAVVRYSTWYGANTVTRPHHIMIGGDDPGNQGHSALETVFHEVSHTMVSPRNGAVARALAATASESGLEVPRGLWHGILFYTVGQVVKQAYREAGVSDFQSFYEEVLPRAWPTFLGPLESEWQPYLDGEIGMDEAIRRLLSRMSQRGEEASG